MSSYIAVNDVIEWQFHTHSPTFVSKWGRGQILAVESAPMGLFKLAPVQSLTIDEYRASVEVKLRIKMDNNPVPEWGFVKGGGRFVRKFKIRVLPPTIK